MINHWKKKKTPSTKHQRQIKTSPHASAEEQKAKRKPKKASANHKSGRKEKTKA